MNAKYMAVFAVAIMLVGCTVLLVNADGVDVDADDSATKVVYVLKEGEAELNIKTTETAVGGYGNSVHWSITDSSSQPEDITDSAGKILASVYVSGSDGSYTLHFNGENVGETIRTITYTVETNVHGSLTDSETLKQTITYTIYLYVLPNSFTASIEEPVQFNNHEPVIINNTNGVDVKFDGITVGDSGDYYIYATGLPKGLALNTDGRIYGTPNVDETKFTDDDSNKNSKEYTVTLVATHKASNISISTTMKITLNKNSDAFTYETTASAIKVTENVFKIVREQNFTVKTVVGGSQASIDAVYLSAANAENAVNFDKVLIEGTNGEYSITKKTLGTGSYTVVMVNGTEMKSFQLIIVEPLEDVEASIGYLPGFTYDATP